MKSIDPVLLQRLIDGELDLSSTQSLLNDAEARPDNWKTIAVAFVENQLWCSEFRHEPELGLLASDEKAPKKPADDPKLPFDLTKWWSMAASLMLAVTVGWLLSSTHSSVPEFDLANTNSVESISSEDKAIDATNSRLDQMVVSGDGHTNDFDLQPVAHQLRLQDQYGNEVLDSELPLYSGRRSDAEKWFRQISQDDSSSARGDYRVEEKTRYLSGRMSDGRTIVIPVRNYHWNPGQ